MPAPPFLVNRAALLSTGPLHPPMRAPMMAAHHAHARMAGDGHIDAAQQWKSGKHEKPDGQAPAEFLQASFRLPGGKKNEIADGNGQGGEDQAAYEKHGVLHFHRFASALALSQINEPGNQAYQQAAAKDIANGHRHQIGDGGQHGKTIGFAFGLLGLFRIPYFMPEANWLFRIGILLWYMTLGAIIGYAATRYGGEGKETVGK